MSAASGAPREPRPGIGRRGLVAAGLASAFAGLPGVSRGQAQASETQVKAAYLYKFLAFVEWPAPAFERADAPIVIGTVDAEPIADELGPLTQGRLVDGRPLVVRRLPSDPVLPLGTHVVFVGRSAAPRLARLAASSRQQPVLIVSELEGALDQGSAINFVLADGKVRFEVALAAIETRGLRVSARLLAVAQRVRPHST